MIQICTRRPTFPKRDDTWSWTAVVIGYCHGKGCCGRMKLRLVLGPSLHPPFWKGADGCLGHWPLPLDGSFLDDEAVFCPLIQCSATQEWPKALSVLRFVGFHCARPVSCHCFVPRVSKGCGYLALTLPASECSGSLEVSLTSTAVDGAPVTLAE